MRTTQSGRRCWEVCAVEYPQGKSQSIYYHSVSMNLPLTLYSPSPDLNTKDLGREASMLLCMTPCSHAPSTTERWAIDGEGDGHGQQWAYDGWGIQGEWVQNDTGMKEDTTTWHLRGAGTLPALREDGDGPQHLSCTCLQGGPVTAGSHLLHIMLLAWHTQHMGLKFFSWYVVLVYLILLIVQHTHLLYLR